MTNRITPPKLRTTPAPELPTEGTRAADFDAGGVDLEAFLTDLRQIRREVDSTLGPRDLRHLRRLERLGRAATLLGLSTAWIAPAQRAPPQPPRRGARSGPSRAKRCAQAFHRQRASRNPDARSTRCSIAWRSTARRAKRVTRSRARLTAVYSSSRVTTGEGSSGSTTATCLNSEP